MKTAIYARVSTNSQNTDNQVSVLEAWAKQRDFDLVEHHVENEPAWKAGQQAVRIERSGSAPGIC